MNAHADEARYQTHAVIQGRLCLILHSQICKQGHVCRHVVGDKLLRAPRGEYSLLPLAHFQLLKKLESSLMQHGKVGFFFNASYLFLLGFAFLAAISAEKTQLKVDI